MSVNNASSLSAYDLRTEYRVTPLGIGELSPRFSWRLESDRRGAAQAGYRVTVYAVSFLPGAADTLVWDSGWRDSADCFDVAYRGVPLVSSGRYRWTLELRDEVGATSTAGQSWFEMGLLHTSDHRGAWVHRILNADRIALPPGIGTPSAQVRRLFPCPHIRGEFSAERQVVRARAYATARGVYQLFLNGQRVGDHELAPGWTDYRDRVMVQAFDITDQIRTGSNAVGILLNDGWWSGFYGSDRRQQGYHWGRYPEAWAQIMLEYADGGHEVFATDESWRFADGALLYSDLLMGESVDARRDLGNWTGPDYDASRWDHVETGSSDFDSLVPMIDEPIRAMETLKAISIKPVGDVWIVDFGQNLSGRARIVIEEAEGVKVRLRYAEVLYDDGRLYTENLRTTEATDFFISAGKGPAAFETRFTSHGFRYMEISGVTKPPALADMTAIVLRNDIPWSGTLTTSDPDINKLDQNIRWGQLDNHVAVPTDCPQRDERLGWTADAQVFFVTAAYNADVASFYSRWLGDVRYAQTKDGAFPDVAPKIAIVTEGAPAWGDAGVIIPWQLYRMYGDKRLLAESWDSMHRWVDFIAANNPDLIWKRRAGNNFGDWLQIDVLTPRDVLATAYFAESTRLVSETARVLGRKQDAERYAAQAERIREAFRKAFVEPGNRIHGDTQTVYLLALGFNLLPEAARKDLETHLVRKLAEYGNRLTTGFVGTPLLCPVLSDIGRDDLAFSLLERREYPSWLYPVLHGATTMWERWDSWTEEKGFYSPMMNSFNHFAFGAVGEWLYRYVAGLDQAPGSIGFRELKIAPHVGGSLTEVGATYDSPFGKVASGWKRDGKRLTLEIAVPPGVRAHVTVPGSKVSESGKPLNGIADLSGLKEGDSSASFSVPSGRYVFTSDLPAQ
ncbi:MAG TPA: family 78 glycoside hydrolase catalytic domain [Devosia sp.]|nr:family 78 glycoside hydrolase catalytic domain [Devosia sp.]